jgi:hypothetical protein
MECRQSQLSEEGEDDERDARVLARNCKASSGRRAGLTLFCNAVGDSGFVQ